MNVLFVGIGSIGTRHLKNLTAVCNKRGIELNVTALRSGDRPLDSEVSALINKQITALDDTIYDIAFITNPTTLHYDAIKLLKDKSKFFFIEKPIFEDSDYNLDELNLTDKTAYVACPMRYCGAYIKLKEVLKDKRVFSSRIICSSYLPAWRKGVDYRKNYSAIRKLGGGVTIDLIHEMDYMVDLFGMPVESYNFKGTYSDLEIDSDDLSIYISRYQDKLCEVHLDYFGRTYRRTCEAFTKDGTIIADFGAGTLTLENGEVIDCAEDVNVRFVKEIEHLLDIVLNDAVNNNPPKLAKTVLALTLGKKE